MTLVPGTKLGPYEIVALIGAGGMGEVYKARDTRLDRVVALKLLPPDAAERLDRRRRFESEARAISSLSHPHICALFDVGDDGSRSFLVMEYLEGETLDDRLMRGPLPASDVLRYATQIAGALDHAHRAQIVHRDLKPSNVMLARSGLKLLDFGLAKAIDQPPPGVRSTASFDPGKLTGEGTIVGTLQYMAPEQLEGRSIDARTDIFAFGTLLYEMATGRKAFEGASQASLIASILTGQPPPVSLARVSTDRDPVPTAIDHVVGRCLAKNPDERWQTARDLEAELAWIAAAGSRITPAAPASKRPTGWAALVAGLGLALLGGTLWTFRGTIDQPAEASRFDVSLPPAATLGGNRIVTRLAVAPDGRQLAFVATTDGRDQLWVRSLDSLEPRVLEGTEGAGSPFWSPDSRFIGFFDRAAGLLKKVDVAGGPARTIGKAVPYGLPLWSDDGTIIFTEFRKGLLRVSADGGAPTPATRVDAAQGELNHFWPSALPGGRHILYTATRLEPGGQRGTPIVYAAALDSTERREVARLHSRMVFARPGHVLYVQEGALMAQAFDVEKLQLTGEPIQIADGLDYYRSSGNAAFSVSNAGLLAYHGGSPPLQLTWFDRSGARVGTIGKPEQFGSLRISPDGQRAAIEVVQPRLGTSDIWIYDLLRGVAARFTSDVNDENLPVWSPDGGRIVFGSDRGVKGDASADFFVKDASGTSGEELLFAQVGPEFLEDWSGDGRLVAYHDDPPDTGFNIWILPLTGERKPWPLVRTPSEEWGARFSPDSSWVAFASDESGTAEVYLVPVPPNAGRKTRVSTGGGTAPRWRRDGKELFYLSGDGRSVMAATVDLQPAVRTGQPTTLFTLGDQAAFRETARNAGFDVTPDGQRFLISQPITESPSSRITVVLNWAATLRR